MLSIETPIINDRHTNSYNSAITLPVQYALYGRSVLDACADFNDRVGDLHFSSIGQHATNTLTQIAKGLLLNGIAVEEIEAFSSMSLAERGKAHANVAKVIQMSFNDYIYENVESVTSMENFTLSLDNCVAKTCVSLTPDFVYAYATIRSELQSHPLYFAMQQVVYQLARHLTVADDIDLVEMKESQLEDYVTIKNKALVIERLDEIESDVYQFYESDELSESIELLNEKYVGIIEFYDDWLHPELIEDLRFTLNSNKAVRLNIEEVRDWVANKIANHSLYACPVAIALMSDVNALCNSDFSLKSFASEGDDPLMNKLVLLSDTSGAIPDSTWHEIESQGNDAWNNGTDTYFAVDMEHSSWCCDLKAAAQLWEMVTRYMCIEY